MSKAALVVEDNGSHAVLISDELAGVLDGWELDVVGTIAEARRRMGSRRYDLYVLDYWLPDGDGLELLREVRASEIRAPTLVVTTATAAKVAVEAMKLGADDYIVKEEGYLATLPYAIAEVLDRYRLADERRVLEERLHRAERAATLGYLASGLAHHINNPLATIRTFLQLVPTHFGDPEFRERYLALAVADTERIRNLVLDIIRAATVPPEGRDTHRFDDVLAIAEEGVAAELKAKGLVCRRRLPLVVPEIRVHREAAACLFQTLLQNAARFSPEGAEIEVDVVHDPGAHRLVATVRDRGPGIPPEHRDRIFEPFFTTAVHGLGMGLFVAARIADLQNIELSLLPEAPGAAFRVALPLA
ncbi:MAG: response regulator [Deltaproteobacteria bacterium]|nr:response regulator [Deltaproteobacteria bacterium]